MQPQLASGRSRRGLLEVYCLLGVDRCSLSRGGDLEEVY